MADRSKVLKHPIVKEEIKKVKDEHAVKTKSLMKSINKLKENLEKEKYSNQDNVRAKIIERMKKDIGDNETVIEMMRQMINDDEEINKEIVKVLSKGPSRARVLSREELRMEIKRLSGEVTSLKAGGATKKPKRKKSTEESEDQALEESFDNITFDKYKEMKAQNEELKAELDTKQREIDDLKDEKKIAGISLHTLTEKVRDLDTDKQIFERVKAKLKQFKKENLFKDIHLSPEEEEDNEIITLLNKLNKLLDKTKKDIDTREKEQTELIKILDENKKNQVQEVDDLVDEYNSKDEELQAVQDKCTILQREMKKQMFLVAKYKEEMEDAQARATEVKEEYQKKLIERKDKIKQLEEEVEKKDNRVIELQDELDDLLQRTPTKSDASTEFDSLALVKEKRKVAKLTEEIKHLLDVIDRLKLKIQIEKYKVEDQTLEKVRSLSRERK